VLEQQRLADSLAHDPEQAALQERGEEADSDALERALELELQQLDEARAASAGACIPPVPLHGSHLAPPAPGARCSPACELPLEAAAAPRAQLPPLAAGSAAAACGQAQAQDPRQALRGALAGLGPGLSPRSVGLLADMPLGASLELIKGYATGYIDGRCQSLMAEGGDGAAQVRSGWRWLLPAGGRAVAAACRRAGGGCCLQAGGRWLLPAAPGVPTPCLRQRASEVGVGAGVTPASWQPPVQVRAQLVKDAVLQIVEAAIRPLLVEAQARQQQQQQHEVWQDQQREPAAGPGQPLSPGASPNPRRPSSASASSAMVAEPSADSGLGGSPLHPAQVCCSTCPEASCSTCLQAQPRLPACFTCVLPTHREASANCPARAEALPGGLQPPNR
jgi:hypothetical protein